MRRHSVAVVFRLNARATSRRAVFFPDRSTGGVDFLRRRRRLVLPAGSAREPSNRSCANRTNCHFAND
jgi:hypothetical protein